MPASRLGWKPQFRKKYRTLQDEAFARLKSGDEKPMRRFLRVGDTLRVLAACAGPPEGDRRLDSQPYVELSRLAQSAKLVYGSRTPAEPADYRVFWRHSPNDDRRLELVDLVWPCL
jgi:hypothetical protein